MKKLEFVENYKSIVMVKYKSKSTRTVYMSRMYKYLDYAKVIGLTPSHISRKQIRKYLTGMGDSMYNQSLAALHIIYDQVLNQPRKLTGLSYVKSKRNVWQVLTADEVVQIINHTENIKHKTIIACLYTLGLRTSELLSLKLSDIDRANMQIHVRGGKGNKDRLIDISEDMLKMIEVYYRKDRPAVYLFESYTKGVPYSSSSLVSIVSKHQFKIGKKIWPHLLRHSIATHMINSGVNILEIQRFLGHNDVKTTERYYQYLKSKGVVQISQKVINKLKLAA